MDRTRFDLPPESWTSRRVSPPMHDLPGENSGPPGGIPPLTRGTFSPRRGMAKSPNARQRTKNDSLLENTGCASLDYVYPCVLVTGILDAGTTQALYAIAWVPPYLNRCPL